MKLSRSLSFSLTLVAVLAAVVVLVFLKPVGRPTTSRLWSRWPRIEGSQLDPEVAQASDEIDA